MPNPFYDREERRIRSLLRIIIHAALFIVLVSVAVLLISPIALAGYNAPPTSEEIAADKAFTALATVASLVVMTFMMWLMGHFIDRRNFTDFGLWVAQRMWWRDLAFGLALGVVLQGAIFLFQWAVGWIDITGALVASSGAFATAILLPVITYISVGIYEEMLSRGYHLLNFAEGLNSRFIGPRAAVLIAWVLSSLVFGVLHYFNPESGLMSTFNISVAGLFLGLGYILTRSLAIPIGLHISWNFAQGNIFGFPVSGTSAGATFIAIEQGGPELWTGGAFGPEKGMIGLIAIIIGMVITVVYLRIMYGPLRIQTELAEYTPRKHQQKDTPETATIPADGQSTA
ncbi:MAG: type II CAAX endopeptidase family protein [Chloroflexota bacterium]